MEEFNVNSVWIYKNTFLTDFYIVITVLLLSLFLLLNQQII